MKWQIRLKRNQKNTGVATWERLVLLKGKFLYTTKFLYIYFWKIETLKLWQMTDQEYIETCQKHPDKSDSVSRASKSFTWTFHLNSACNGKTSECTVVHIEIKLHTRLNNLFFAGFDQKHLSWKRLKSLKEIFIQKFLIPTDLEESRNSSRPFSSYRTIRDALLACNAFHILTTLRPRQNAQSLPFPQH